MELISSLLPSSFPFLVDDKPPRSIMRGTWFYFDESLDRYVPFNEALASSIDSWFEEEKSKAYLLDQHNPNPSETIYFRAEKDIAFERIKNASGLQQYRFVITRDSSFNVDEEGSLSGGGSSNNLEQAAVNRNGGASSPSFSSTSSTTSCSPPAPPELGIPPLEVHEVVNGDVHVKSQNSMDGLFNVAEIEQDKPPSLITEIDDKDDDQSEEGQPDLVVAVPFDDDLPDTQPPVQRR